MEIIAQVFGFAAIGLSFFIFIQKKRKRMLVCKLLQNLSWATHYLLIGAYSAMATNLVAASLQGTYLYRSNKDSDNLVIVMVYIAFYIVSAFITWQSAFSILPATSSVLSVIAFNAKKPLYIKLISIPASLCTLIYNIAVAQSISVYIGVSISLTTVFYSLCTHFINYKKQKGEAR